MRRSWPPRTCWFYEHSVDGASLDGLSWLPTLESNKCVPVSSTCCDCRIATSLLEDCERNFRAKGLRFIPIYCILLSFSLIRWLVLLPPMILDHSGGNHTVFAPHVIVTVLQVNCLWITFIWLSKGNLLSCHTARSFGWYITFNLNLPEELPQCQNQVPFRERKIPKNVWASIFLIPTSQGVSILTVFGLEFCFVFVFSVQCQLAKSGRKKWSDDSLASPSCFSVLQALA